MTIKTRFAPSPTGLLHIGGARTALFNYLFAKHHKGEFLLRIEDTDKTRSTPEAVKVILDGLDWLNLKPDNDPVYQSSRQARHIEVANQLLSSGKAYKCYCSPDELQAMRDAASDKNSTPRYDGTWRDRDPSEAPDGVKPVIRLKANLAGESIIDDIVQGRLAVKNSTLDDMIILRSDGTPTYLLAAVVDDYDMGITHVIRGDDHRTNMFRQNQIYEALGWHKPKFAHIPLIHGPDGKKLSKRHGAVSIMDFKDQGFLSDAMCNYLVKLGWSHTEDFLTREDLIKLFDIEAVVKSPARMDYPKLINVNKKWMKVTDDKILTDEVVTRLKDRGYFISVVIIDRITKLMPGLKERSATLEQMTDSAMFVFDDYKIADEAQKIIFSNKEILRKTKAALKKIDFTKEQINVSLKEIADQNNLKLGQVAQPLRAMLTGMIASPSIDDVLIALGKDIVLERMFLN